MAEVPDKTVAGHAALSICESLLIAMRDLNLMTEKDVRDVLDDAATAPRTPPTNAARCAADV